MKVKLGLTEKKWDQLNEQLLEAVVSDQVDVEKYQFIGEAILKTIVGNILFDECVNNDKFLTEGDLTKYSHKIISNNDIYCFLKRKNINVYPSNSTDIIKKIIGILYDYLYYSQDLSNSIEIIQHWFYNNLYINKFQC